MIFYDYRGKREVVFKAPSKVTIRFFQRKFVMFIVSKKKKKIYRKYILTSCILPNNH
jgi:hypothetical protein